MPNVLPIESILIPFTFLANTEKDQEVMEVALKVFIIEHILTTTKVTVQAKDVLALRDTG